MKTILILLFLSSFFCASGQYYYKDIIGTKESFELVRNYKNNNVQRVQLNSFDADNTKNETFFVEQIFTPRLLKTITRTGDENSATLTSYINELGQIEKTIDSSDALVAVSHYSYAPSGELQIIKSTSSDSSGTFVQTEEHRWEYGAGKIVRMLRIKNSTDTTFVLFKRDDSGNISEEQTTRKGVAGEPVYYYYNDQSRLTDIVRFNAKAKRLLPEYMFEYSAAGQVIQKITVPSNNSEYLIWRYQYGKDGLKIREAIYTRGKQLTGKIEYVYQLGDIPSN